MLFVTNASYHSLINNYNHQVGRFHASMKRLSTGQRILLGDAPADLGISERFRLQVKNGKEAGRVIQNAVNLLESTDAWLQEVQNILGRMNELAIGSLDGSKTSEDRKNLDLEFQQLKSEIGRIAEAGKYNQLQINGKTAVATWDSVDKRIVYSQPDGSDVRKVDIDLRAGNIATTGEILAFEDPTSGFVGDFLFAEEGNALIYVAQESDGNPSGIKKQQTLMKLDIPTKSILAVDLPSAGGTSATTQPRIKMDEKERIWTTGLLSASGKFQLHLLDYKNMILDEGGADPENVWAGNVIIASSFSEFTVHNDYAYFIEEVSGSHRYVKQNIYDVIDREVLLADLSANFNLNESETYAISPDGQYLAFKNVESGETESLTIVNALSGKTSKRTAVGSDLTSVVSLGFDANNKLYWTNTGDDTARNEVRRLQLAAGEEPVVVSEEVVRTGAAGRFGTPSKGTAIAHGMGLSISRHSPASNYDFQVGADYGIKMSFGSADVRLVTLGISDLNVRTALSADKAMKALPNAVNIISQQRAYISSQVSRFNFIHSANESFVHNLSSAENRIRDVDFAAESAKMTEAQILSQAGSAIITQSKGFRASILQFLQ